MSEQQQQAQQPAAPKRGPRGNLGSGSPGKVAKDRWRRETAKLNHDFGKKGFAGIPSLKAWARRQPVMVKGDVAGGDPYAADEVTSAPALWLANKRAGGSPEMLAQRKAARARKHDRAALRKTQASAKINVPKKKGKDEGDRR